MLTPEEINALIENNRAALNRQRSEQMEKRAIAQLELEAEAYGEPDIPDEELPERKYEPASAEQAQEIP